MKIKDLKSKLVLFTVVALVIWAIQIYIKATQHEFKLNDNEWDIQNR